MHADPILSKLVATILVILVIGLVLRRFKQPHVLGYLVAGVAMGPHGLAVFDEAGAIERLGNLGIVLLLFFVGLEMSIQRLAANWRIAVIGTLLQTLVSSLAAWGIGAWLGWPAGRIVLVGFVITLSSTAVVVAMLSTWGHMDTQLGRDVMGILIVQDLAIAPMLLCLSFLSAGSETTARDVLVPTFGALLVLAFGVWLLRQDRIRLPFGDRVKNDHELQVFAAAFLCLSFALVTSLLELSTALGAFLAGIVVASSEETEWVFHSLEPFRVILVALFFVSIGLLVDVGFVAENLGVIGLLVAMVLVTNTFVNGTIVHVFGRPWRYSLFAGALMAQAGDFSFVLAAIGLEGGLITDAGYQMAVSVIFGSLLLSPFWVEPFRRWASEDLAATLAAEGAEAPSAITG